MEAEINFFYETDFSLVGENVFKKWIIEIIESESKQNGDINFIFCDDEYLHSINLKYLDHDTLTDIISFDYTEGDTISGDIFISIQRVKENAEEVSTRFSDELKRVMSHGVLHFCGYKDKTERESDLMRRKEEEKMQLFHVEQ